MKKDPKRNYPFVVPVLASFGLLMTFLYINNSISLNPTYYTLVKKDSINYSRVNMVKLIKSDTFTVCTVDMSSVNNKQVFKLNGDVDFHNYIYNKNPAFLIWVALIVAMMAIAAGAFPIYILEVVNLFEEYKLSRKWQIISLAVSLAVIIMLIIVQITIVGVYDTVKSIRDFGVLFKAGCEEVPANISLIMLILIVPILMTIFIISIILREADIINKIESYILIDKLLMNSLQVLAIIIVLSVVTTASLGQSIKNQIKIDPNYFDIFPKEFSYMYGLLFSLFLAIIFIPVYIQSHYTSQQIIARYSKSPVKTALISNLKKENSIVTNLKLILTVISPLLSVILPDSLNLIK